MPDRHLRAQPGHSAGRVLHRDAGLALDLLAGDSARRRGGCHGLARPAAGPAQAGALPCVRLARPAAGRARAGHAGHRPAAGRAPGLAQLAADPRAAGRRRRADGPVPAERVVPPAAVLQDPAAAQPQPQPLAAHAGRRAGGAAGRDPDPFELPGAAARLPATGNRAGAAGHGPAPADRAAVGGRAVQPAPGRLPLGAGRRPACWRCHARWARS